MGKMRPRIEQMNFGPELFEYIKRLIESIDTIEDLENIALNVSELNIIIENIKDTLADKLQTLDFVPRLIVLEDIITFIDQEDIFIEIPSKAIELKTIKFENLTNNDNLKLIISEKNDFTTEDYSSLIREQVYDIANIPIIDQDNNEEFKLKLRFVNKTANDHFVKVKYRIKLTNFSLNEGV